MTVAKNEHTQSRRKAPPAATDLPDETAAVEATPALATPALATPTDGEPEVTADASAEVEVGAADAPAQVAASDAATETAMASDTAPQDEAPAPADTLNGRDRIQHQLAELKRRESELRRELAIADHPELADAIRTIEGRAYGVTRVEAKLAQGLSKSEHRRKETLEKKLASARERRAEIELSITQLEQELAPLGEARLAAFAEERAVALSRLVELLVEHEGALAAAGLEIASLVPSLSEWQADIDAMRAVS